jgi:hypothetical protein
LPTRSRSRKYQIAIYRVDGSGTTSLPEAGPVDQLAWSPDSTELVFQGSSDTYRIAVTGGAPSLSASARGDTTDWLPGSVPSVEPVASDTTAPTVTGTPDRSPNGDGWYNAPVTITWAATDPEPSSGRPFTPPRHWCPAMA